MKQSQREDRSMSKHTLGPWGVTRDEDGVICVDGGTADGVSNNGFLHPIARCPAIGTTHGERLANARLIAAAPELLEALEEMLEPDGDSQQDKIEKARAAIAKARGEQP